MDVFKQKLQEKYMKQTLALLNVLISCISRGRHEENRESRSQSDYNGQNDYIEKGKGAFTEH